MADLVRLTRPWLLSAAAFSSSSVLSPRAVSPGLLRLSRGISTTTPRHATGGALRRKPKISELQMSKLRSQQADNSASRLIPMTLVSPPIARFPRQPRDFFRFAWLLLKNRALTRFTIIGIQMMSMPRILLSRPRLKVNRSSALPAAKNLHVQMCEAVASGDKEMLRRICATELFVKLSGAIDARPPHLATTWELLHYESDRWWNVPRYPRLSDFRVMYGPTMGGGSRIVKQAVVSIASVQRLDRSDRGRGDLRTLGGDKEKHMLEHIVIQSEVDTATYESGPWKIWGNLPESTLESYLEEVKMVETLTRDM
ncbi:hypothetical protein F4778DRAFT_243348 [Xylariomycetidae sp. FL2044]|nr:hypothetical protein F4778DRAFT_243348 [Xylariomycetidae sp. FL2044]